MKRYVPVAFALLFLFVFVFSFAATSCSDVKAGGSKCLACCYKPPNNDCSAEWGQIYSPSLGCSCMSYVYCMPSPCKFWCRVCK